MIVRIVGYVKPLLLLHQQNWLQELLHPVLVPDRTLDVKPNIHTMSTYTKIKFWSFLIIGVVCTFIGGFLYPYGPDKRSWAEFLLLIGVGQLLIWVVLFFVWYRRKNKETANA